ncbi:carbamoyl-phosphate synthase large subunit [Lactobacillus delbrueckii subsp. lactis]|uniref:Carbamoyl phosphate synthase large chain n=3 Tax=Lactobacillus delbrueckii TaxID=1584 RepID=A0A3G6JDN8_LACDL|nr:carbamoyl-phosphate synthase large subunit [Lactobacillus delbrueckii]AZA16109.1 MAG: carbamoyl-phosphate synthase large subunit [Lactobacillus delbrueckii subsp. lactis]MCD5433588.1 carbamoyl-phosphate synthase large subunit [Lactobacillus delbrueckii subsp. lactis]MCD5576379.1 carbamoyl-phosphate synthase large subunit [Lactobacillus delbrueckii subsp. lactis]MDQ7162196.1 carbamoyl-phosphate synthase large subunit [Lactobacillus delbrueckii subsp. lactis]MDQ7164192.1 carbamoyl-phosphate s
MPKCDDIKKVLVIGSGPIIIGQAAEFDYAGTQACRALREEGIEVVLINSNPATIMTDGDMADHVYIEPLTVPVVKQLMEKEKPDALLPTMGGQNALNIAMALADEGFLEKHHVKTIGTDTDTIKMAEDRLEFKNLMERIGEPVAKSVVVNYVEDAIAFAKEIGYPVVVRPAYTLGGTGGGIAHNEQELHEICSNGLRLSRVTECLIEQSIAGWKEVEYEVMRDGAGNCITVCNMENMDPVGVHTGDSIVVAPSQTLSDKDYQMLRSSALNIITALNIKGGCNVQFALNPDSFEYCVIEVNPRVSRSSALASKATGYPIAKLATKIALGYNLDEIVNAVTGKTYASYEPTLDYIVCKIPKWPFDKFYDASRKLGTQMKATGEVMAICNNFEGAFMKALRSLEQDSYYLYNEEIAQLSADDLRKDLRKIDDKRAFRIAEALRKGVSIREIHAITKIDVWFIDKIKHLVEIEDRLKSEELTPDLLKLAKHCEFPDRVIASLTGKTVDEVYYLRKGLKITAAFKTVDTCAAEFDAETPYFYSIYGGEHEIQPDRSKKKVIVFGSGPIRIGQGIEFDYCCVHSVWALKEAGYETIIVNNNPETVSTDFDIADRLYFEPLTAEDVQSIIELEQPDGAIVQFGGQTAIKLSQDLMKMGVPILGTSADSVDAAEDRERFDEILEKCQIDRPKGQTVFTAEEALKAANELGYPVLVRPSYVLGGAGMEIALNDGDLKRFIDHITSQFNIEDHPILIDKYLAGKECEVDAICDDEGILIPGIMEHVERAGVHSGDSISIYPPQKISQEMKERIVEYSKRLAKALKVKGLMNIQFIVYENKVYVIEVNPRSSRTIPYISKVTGIPLVDVATNVIIGKSIKEQGYDYGLAPEKKTVAVKMPVFSFEKITGAEIALGPEMKSTGEVLGISDDVEEAMYKAFMGTGLDLPKHKKVICTVKDSAKEEFLPIAKEYHDFGYDLYATQGTYDFLQSHGIPARLINRINDKENTIFDLILTETVDLVIDIPTRNNNLKDGFLIRRFAVEAGVPIYTSLDTARALIHALEAKHDNKISLVDITKL